MREASLDLVLEPGTLSVRFEPVFDVSGPEMRLHYVECLIRGPQGTSLESADLLFAHARKRRKTGDLDRACISKIMQAANTLPPDVSIAVNVHASTLALDGELVPFILREAGTNGIASGRLVVEVVEHEPPWDIARFGEALSALRRQGVRIALDDIGLGHSNYRMILDCRPDYFKIDRYFVAGCHSDFYRQAVLKSVVQLAPPFRARVVAEGVESAEDLAMIRTLGIDLVQGWLFGRPVPHADGHERFWRPRVVRAA